MTEDIVARRRIAPAEWRWVAGVVLVALIISIALNIYGYLNAGDDQFAGLVYNPQDGNSYLAKMRQGVRGEWLYTIPFTADPGDGVLVYPHYLLLGHVARWLNTEPVFVFDTARLFAGAALLVSLYAFIARFIETEAQRRTAFLLAAFGSGLGWIALLFGKMTPDVWQAEIYPVLSILSNPHYPLALAAMLWVFDALIDDLEPVLPRRLVAGTLVLALTQPYGIVNVLVAAGPLWAWLAWYARRWPQPLTMRLIAVVLLSAPVVGYTQWAVLSTPALAGWDRQNLTMSSPLWEYLVAIGLALPPALSGAYTALRAPVRSHSLLLTWVATSLLLMYLPFYQQQRRFALGLYIPFSILAIIGLYQARLWRRNFWQPALFIFSALTSFLVLLLAFIAMLSRPSSLYFTGGEWEGLLYLRREAPQRALVLTSPDMGLYIPAWAGQRVFYGHAHETLDAPARFAEVTAYFAGTLADPAVLLNRADFIFVGPRERKLGTPSPPANFRVVFTSPGTDGVTIYRREP